MIKIACTFILVFIWSEIWHYYSHKAMHSKLLWSIHRHHHKSKITNPLTSMSFSIAEKIILSVGILAPVFIFSQFYAVSFHGIIVYYFVYFFANTIGHSNDEFMPQNYAEHGLGLFFTTSTYHLMHHARFSGNYGLMTTILDKLHKTIEKDYSEIQNAAVRKAPLKSFGRKLS